jgi:hypothetical protein
MTEEKTEIQNFPYETETGGTKQDIEYSRKLFSLLAAYFNAYVELEQHLMSAPDIRKALNNLKI